MSDNKNKQLSQLLSELKTEYLQSFPKKIKLLKEITAKEDWEQIYEEYHKLKGTGKTYGVPEISLICEKLEELASHVETQKKPLFNDAIMLLEEVYQGLLAGQPVDINNHPFGKTLLRLGRKK